MTAQSEWQIDTPSGLFLPGGLIEAITSRTVQRTQFILVFQAIKSDEIGGKTDR